MSQWELSVLSSRRAQFARFLERQMKISGDLYLPFAFMDPSYKFTSIVSKGFFLRSIALTSKKANNARIFSIFSERSKMDNYLKFLKKYFTVKL